MGHQRVFRVSTPLARRMALDILRRCLDHNQDIQAATDDVLVVAPDGPDKGLATELAYGYLRLRGRLDFLLNQLLRNPVQTSPVLRRILGVAAYELLFLSRIPEYATLDWAVTLAKDRLDPTMGKVANGVLRSLLRLGRAVHHPDYFQAKTAGVAAFLAAWYSCPSWLARMWLSAYGQEQAETLLRASLQTPPLGARINRLHPEANALRQQLASTAEVREFEATLTQWPEFLHAAETNGVLTRQSLAAQRIMDVLGVDLWPDPILDACAGRGGKTFLMAERGKEVWAADVNVFRLGQFGAECRRLGFAVPVFRAPAQGPSPLRQAPRTIFLDAPCSGLGVLSRRPDIKWKRTPADCATLASLQRDMLAGAAGLLPGGGGLVYVTCTMNPAENETQIASFIHDHPNFSLVRQARTPMSEHLGEFFFGAVLHKKN